MFRKIIATAGLVFIAGAGLSLWQARSLRNNEALLAVETLRQSDLKRDLAEALQTAKKHEDQARELVAKIAKLPATKTRETTPKAKPPSLMQLLDENPELAQLWARRKRASSSQTYGALFAGFKFSPDEIVRFNDIWKDHDERSQDIYGALSAQGVSSTDPAIEPLLKEELDRYRAALVAGMGEARAGQIREYERKIRPRQLTDGLSASVAFTSPLTRQQAEQLTQIMADATPGYVAGKDADSKNVDWETVDLKAQAVLTPAQFAAWKNEDLHDPKGFESRSDIALREVYERAVEAEKNKTDPGEAPRS